MKEREFDHDDAISEALQILQENNRSQEVCMRLDEQTVHFLHEHIGYFFGFYLNHIKKKNGETERAFIQEMEHDESVHMLVRRKVEILALKSSVGNTDLSLAINSREHEALGDIVGMRYMYGMIFGKTNTREEESDDTRDDTADTFLAFTRQYEKAGGIANARTVYFFTLMQRSNS